MDASKTLICLALAAALLLVGCATSPEAEQQRLQKEASIAEILSQPLDPAEYGEVKRCLSDMDFRRFEALDDRHILFEGRRDRLWINTLRGPCPDLRFGLDWGIGMRCTLGKFQPVTEEQVDEIKAVIRSR